MPTMDQPSLAQFADYLPRIQALGLAPGDLAAIPVHPEPASADEFVSLGELPPGAPPADSADLPIAGSRQLYAYHAEVEEPLWQRLVTVLAPTQPSGTGGTGMIGTPSERVVDEENPDAGWRRLDQSPPWSKPA